MSLRPDPSDDDASAGAVFAALADAGRRRIVRTLRDGGPSTATALADGLGVTRQAAAKQLRILEEAGLVVAARTGREVRFTLEPAPLSMVVDWLVATTAAEWDARLGRLAQLTRKG